MESLYAKHIKLLTNLKTTFRNSFIENIPWNARLIGITGARGVGKTTLLLQYIKETYNFNQTALYVSLDDIAFPFTSLTELIEEFTKRGGTHLFIDEIHKTPNWSQILKSAYDSHPDLNIVFTGSSILDIHKGKADLSRRALVFEMQGLSFRQFLEIETGEKFAHYSLNELLNNHAEIAISIYQKVKPFQYFDSYLKYGYFPFYLEDKAFYSMRLASVLNQIIEVDMPSILNIDLQYIEKIKRFVNLLAADIPLKPNVSALGAAMGISWQTVVNYLNYLHRAKLIEQVFPVSKGVKSLAKPEKIYLHHPNLFFVFKEESANKGNLRESFFVNQLAYKHKVEIPKQGDFLIDEKYTFEIGGKSKSFNQISGINDSYIAADAIEFGFENKIPLWLFGFLY